MKDIYRAVDHIANRLVRGLDCKPVRPKAQPDPRPRIGHAPKYVWRAPDARPRAESRSERNK
jgi:hypothetical protein